jgi:sugar phosphate isomerase/epimerase
MRESLEFAEEIGACLVNVHLHVDDGINAYVEAIAPLMKRLKRAGIRLSIENTPLTGPEEFNALFAGLANLKYEEMRQVGMCLDIGHANLYAPTCNDFLKFSDLLSSQVPIIHVHLHENYGDYDSHLPLFMGPAGRDASGIEQIIKRLKKRGFSDCIILEQWPEPPGLLNEARDRLKDMIGNCGKEEDHETTKKDDHL